MRRPEKPEVAVEVILGITCEFQTVTGRDGRPATSATFNAIRTIHAPKTVLDAYALVKGRASSINTIWMDPPSEGESECRSVSEA